MRNVLSRLFMYSAVCLSVGLLLCRPVFAKEFQVEPSNEARSYFCIGAGWLDYSGGMEVQDAPLLSARLGYDYSDMWGYEGVLYLMPDIKENTVGFTEIGPDGNIVTGRRSRVEDPNRAGFGSTYGGGMALDGLFHFTRWERLDPFLSLGVCALWYGHQINGKTFDPSVRFGGGVMYHFNDEWAVRADYRAYIIGNDTEAASTIDAGVVWTWGARVPPKIVASGGPLDSDHDGLTDVEEEQWKTNPYDPDTDKDGLLDGEEVHTYHTDPLNPDTDGDLLKDGEEVHGSGGPGKMYITDPLVADTDGGGVIDGHEVLEDGTNPTKGHGDDDLVLYELYIQFEYDKAVIKPDYYKQLDVIGKVLGRHPKATAKVEGHCDRFNTKGHVSEAEHNKKLSIERAKSVVTYVATKCAIADDRLSSNGYGFERPKDPKKVDLKNGNPENRRVEIYIKGVNKTKAQLESEGYVIPAVDPTPPVPVSK